MNDSATRTPASGTQHLLQYREYEAVVASVGASLRLLTFGGRDLVVPFQAEEVRPAYRGAVLAPWANRVVDGAYFFSGQQHQLGITEPTRRHALHGLASWLDFTAIEAGPSRLLLQAIVEPQAGYPWRVLIQVGYELSRSGLTQRVLGRNLSDSPAPWGTAAHPYLVAGSAPLDEWTLELPAERVLHVTRDRLIPTEVRAVDDIEADRFDFRIPRPLGTTEIDHAFTGLIRDPAGMATVRLLDPSGGTGVAMSWDAACRWVQVHTADLPGGGTQPGHRAGLALEPMTSAPDAFNASFHPFDAGLVVLQPGMSSSAEWMFTALDGDPGSAIE